MRERTPLLGLFALTAALGCGNSSPAGTIPEHGAPAEPALIAQAILANARRAAGAPSVAQTTPSSAAYVVVPDPNPAPARQDYAVGTVRVVIEAAKGPMSVQLWYPAVESARAEAQAGRSVLEFEPTGPDRAQWSELIRDATPYFTQRTMHAADAPPALATPEALPLILISHCTDCLRFGYYPVAERLAAHGFLVAAPNHINNTLYDNANGASYGLDLDAGLQQRQLEITALTDALLNANTESIPRDLRGRADVTRIGMLGHSLGAITTSYTSTRDPRIRATVFLTMLASLDNRLPYTGDQLAMQQMLQPLSKPALFVLATEDLLSLSGINDDIRQNFENYPAPAWLATLQDTGHYSVTNLCGINDAMTNGCGPGNRISQFLAPFTYLNIDFATDLTAQLATTFFEQQLLGASSSSFESIVAQASSVLRVERHTP